MIPLMLNRFLAWLISQANWCGTLSTTSARAITSLPSKYACSCGASKAVSFLLLQLPKSFAPSPSTFANCEALHVTFLEYDALTFNSRSPISNKVDVMRSSLRKVEDGKGLSCRSFFFGGSPAWSFALQSVTRYVYAAANTRPRCIKESFASNSCASKSR